MSTVPSVSPKQAWKLASQGQARILDLRTRAERERYGWPPGAQRVSLLRHALWPQGAGTIYLCQHANRSKLTARRGAPEVEGGWVAWEEAGSRSSAEHNLTGRSPGRHEAALMIESVMLRS
ncbi:MAG: rhodanese-like domain-containing protein [Solirubrobacteraceae bacterium]|jgi:rhodanese-related sulfurtransferase